MGNYGNGLTQNISKYCNILNKHFIQNWSNMSGKKHYPCTSLTILNKLWYDMLFYVFVFMFFYGFYAFMHFYAFCAFLCILYAFFMHFYAFLCIYAFYAFMHMHAYK